MERRTGITKIKDHLPQNPVLTQERVWVNLDGQRIELTEAEKKRALDVALRIKILNNKDQVINNLTEEEANDAIGKALNTKLGEVNLIIYQNRVFNPPPIKLMSAEDMFNHALFCGKTLVEQNPKKKFLLTKEEEHVYWSLALYFAKDKRFEELSEYYSLHKSICLYGNIGCGKTTALEVYRRISNPTFPIVATETLSREVKNYGTSIIDKYIKYLSIGLDDVGNEAKAQYMGNITDIVREILSARYDREKYTGFKTHMTTNLIGEQFLVYGERLSDRMNEIFNQIEFPATSLSKR